MQFLANENFPVRSVKRLREAGYDVASVIEDSPGAEDTEVLARATREQRVVKTWDEARFLERQVLDSVVPFIKLRCQSN